MRLHTKKEIIHNDSGKGEDLKKGTHRQNSRLAELEKQERFATACLREKGGGTMLMHYCVETGVILSNFAGISKAWRNKIPII